MTTPSVNEHRHCRASKAAIFASMTVIALVMAASGGCQSKAHQDLYQQKMASEIRVLEDQLYEADYENRILRDELKREKSRVFYTEYPSQSAPSSPPQDDRSRPERDDAPSARDDAPRREETPQRDRTPPRRDPPTRDREAPSREPERADDFDSMELELPELDEGEAVESDVLSDPGGLPSMPDLPPAGDAPPAVDPPRDLPPAPGGPEPPGKDDLQMPQIVPGELIPPPASEEDELKPPGQVELPDSVRSGAGLPEELRIHTALSGGHRIDGKVDQMMIVVNALDRYGKIVNLERFDIGAEMSIVILDPDVDSPAAQLGRWDFTATEVEQMVKSRPISGFHVPLETFESEPTGEDIIVHVRLRAPNDEMRCEARLKVEKQAAIAEWTPRGEALR